MDDALGAMMEPLAVALHAVKRAGTVSGKRVLVTGGGPIGLLVAMTARAFGATPVALSDIVAARRETALQARRGCGARSGGQRSCRAGRASSPATGST